MGECPVLHFILLRVRKYNYHSFTLLYHNKTSVVRQIKIIDLT